MKTLKTLLFALALAVLAFGCSSGDSQPTAGSDDTKAEGANAPALEGVFLTAKPDGAKPLAEVKGAADKGDAVTFSARIGGRKNPFVEGRAVMVVIDPALPSCADNEGDGCPVPWDYCCETRETLVANTATVQIVGDDGKPHALNLKGQGGIAELDWITVVGKVTDKDDSGLFVVNATGLFLEKKG